MFPYNRLSRLRRNEALRLLTEETKLQAENFIYPVFVEENITENTAIQTLPGQIRIAESNLTQNVKNLYNIGVKAIILFGISHYKDAIGSDSLRSDGLLSRMIKIAKDAAPEMLIIADICFCEYTNHGHCGKLSDGFIDNDTTIKMLGEQAVIAAESGADIVAPSAMLDGQVQAIRQALDANGFAHIPIMSYGIKYASAFYGPFREAAASTICENNKHNNRKTYQMNVANAREALLEAQLDEQEGVDILIVKPAITSLDIIAKLRANTNLPISAYQVSGEYSAIKFAAMANAIDADAAMIESAIAIKRAGADSIISYFTPEIINLIK